jgi:hypothetical protein
MVQVGLSIVNAIVLRASQGKEIIPMLVAFPCNRDDLLGPFQPLRDLT